MPLGFLHSAQNRSYDYCVWHRTALTKTTVWTKCPLQKLWFGENCPYVFCIQLWLSARFVALSSLRPITDAQMVHIARFTRRSTTDLSAQYQGYRATRQIAAADEVLQSVPRWLLNLSVVGGHINGVSPCFLIF